MKKNIKDLTVVAVTSTKIHETIYALEYTAKQIKCKNFVLLTSEEIKEHKSNKIKIEKIPKIKSLDEYSDFIIYELYKYIETDFCLIIQWDGFVINSNFWSEEYKKYDYIGARFKKRKDDDQYACDKNGTFYEVGNGGFSLRSKRLLSAPAEYQLKRPAWSKSKNEDGFFCVEQRKKLESLGFVWAPIEIADAFSNECGFKSWRIFKGSFGFHGKRLLQRHKFLKWLPYVRY